MWLYLSQSICLYSYVFRGIIIPKMNIFRIDFKSICNLCRLIDFLTSMGIIQAWYEFVSVVRWKPKHARKPTKEKK